MKKILILMAMFAIVFTSCNKYDASDPVEINSYPTVKLSGIVLAEFDAAEGYVSIPNGTMLYFTVPNSSYMTGVQGVSKYETIVSDGAYSVEIPVPKAGVQVTITSNDFNRQYTASDFVSYDQIFYLATTTADLNQNADKVENLIFSSKNLYEGQDTLIVPDKTSTVSGNLTYLSKLSSYLPIDDPNREVWSVIPSGTKLKVEITLAKYTDDTYVYEEEQTITVGSNGQYSITVPMIKDGKATVKIIGAEIFEYTLYSSATEFTTSNYRYSLTGSMAVYEIPLTKNFKFNPGTELY
jgi:uncharacterized protein YcnI